MDAPVPVPLLSYVNTMPDPRSPDRRQHKLVDVVTIALCAVFSGADSWIEVADGGRVEEPWLRTFLDLPAGIASHDTFSRVFRLLDPLALETVLRDCVVDGLQTGFAAPVDQAATVEKGHGRIEKRTCWFTEDAAFLRYLDPDGRRPGSRSVAVLQAERTISAAKTTELRSYLSSLLADTARLNQIVRTHWQIENHLHWVLDTAFDEDQCRVRMGDGAQNLALLRRVALSLLKHDQTASLASRANACERDGMSTISYTS